MAQATPQQLRQWFDSMDTDGNGHLTAQELQTALAHGNLHFSLSSVAHIIRIHDRDNSGTISFEEFSKLHEFLTNVQRSFEYFDTNRRGSLGLDKIQQALSHAGYNLDDRVLQTVFQRFDPSKSGHLQLTEFLALTLFLRSATATFNAYDPQRSGMVHLNFNQFLYAAANTI